MVAEVADVRLRHVRPMYGLFFDRARPPLRTIFVCSERRPLLIPRLSEHMALHATLSNGKALVHVQLNVEFNQIAKDST